MSVRNDTPQVSDEQGPVTTGLKRVVAASTAGTVVEWYEFFLYGTAATSVFSKVFFAKGDSLALRPLLNDDFVTLLARVINRSIGRPAVQNQDLVDPIPFDLRHDRTHAVDLIERGNKLQCDGLFRRPAAEIV